MDKGFEFEELINHYLGRPNYVTYAENWYDNNERISLLYTACIIEYDKNSTGVIGEQLQYFMEELFNDRDDKSISISCLNFLKELTNDLKVDE